MADGLGSSGSGVGVGSSLQAKKNRGNATRMPKAFLIVVIVANRVVIVKCFFMISCHRIPAVASWYTYHAPFLQLPEVAAIIDTELDAIMCVQRFGIKFVDRKSTLMNYSH